MEEGKRIMKASEITREMFHKAVLSVLNEKHFEALRSDPERAKAAVHEMWMDRDVSSQEAEIIRRYLKELNTFGDVEFASNVS